MTADANANANDPGGPGIAAATRVLAIWAGGSASFSFSPGQTVRIGRDRDSELPISLLSVSRRHAVLTVGSAKPPSTRATLVDVGGMGGISISGEKIPQHLPVPVGPGDIIELGGAILLIHAAEAPRAVLKGPVARAAPRRPAADDSTVERLIDMLAETELPLLLVGGTGVGKTFIASAIHARSARAQSPLRILACAGASREDIERDLFGYEDSDNIEPGMIEITRGGTLVLRDVDELPLETQAKLLDAVGRRRTTRLGATKERAVDVRLVGMTKADLLAAAAEGRFSAALYERLNGAVIVVPGLRERAGEIARFAARFLAAVTRPGRRPPRLSSEALGVLIRHPFSANLRELREAMERAYPRSTAGFVGPEHLSLEAPATEPPPSILSTREPATRRFAPMTPTEPPDAPTDELPIIIPPPAPTPRPLPSSPPRQASSPPRQAALEPQAAAKLPPAIPRRRKR